MNINEVQDEIIGEFEEFEDWMDKYQLLIDMGNSLEQLDEQYKQPQFLIEGCQSRVWIHADFADGKVYLQAESDTVIVKGIIALLVRILSGRTSQEILAADLYFINKIGLKEHLSPTRSNGLVSMIKQIRNYALVYKLKAQE
jgi:cysteine desulfuration protein SufE